MMIPNVDDALLPDALPIPPSPWPVTGSALVVIGHLSRARARALAASPRGFIAPRLLGSLCVLGLIHYDTTPVGPYNELALTPGVLWRQLPGLLISHMLVDSTRSRMGGRAIWGLPKELAHFTWAEQQIAITTPDAQPLLTAHWAAKKHAGHLLIPPAPIITLRGPRCQIFTMGGWAADVHRAKVTLDIPPASPYAPLTALVQGPYLAWHLGHFHLKISNPLDLL